MDSPEDQHSALEFVSPTRVESLGQKAIRVTESGQGPGVFGCG